MQSDGNFLSSQWGKRRWGHTNIFHRAMRVLMMSVFVEKPFSGPGSYVRLKPEREDTCTRRTSSLQCGHLRFKSLAFHTSGQYEVSNHSLAFSPPPPLLISLEEESKTVHKHWLRPNIEYEIFNKCLTPLGYHFQSTTIYKELTRGICKNNSVKTTFKDIGLHEDNLPILLHNNLAVQRSQNTHRCAHHLCSARLQIALWGWHCSLLCLSALLAQ